MQMGEDLNLINGHKDVSYIVKATNNCNMGCGYCYYRHNKAQGSDNRMSTDVLRQTIASMLGHNQSCANFIWHGGEPLMMGIGFFEDIVDFQNGYLKSTGKEIAVSNCVQTNGLLLDDEWIDFLKRNGFNVSISLDGYFGLHSKNRGTSPETFNRIMENVVLLSRRGMQFSVLTVVTKETVGHEEELFDFFADFDIESFGFLPMNYGSPDDCLSANEYGSFLCRFFDIWTSKGKTNLEIREFDEFIRGYLGQPQRLCHHTDLCDCYMTVTPNGDLYPCDCYPQDETTKLGNVYGSIAEAHEKSKLLFQGAYTLPDECEHCDYGVICNGGCKYHRWIARKDYAAPHFYCKATKALYDIMASCLASIGE